MDTQPGFAELRRQAEALADRMEAESPVDLEAVSPEAGRRLLRELQVRQFELELQSEELRRVETELDALRARHAELYDLAPVGYLTLSEQGVILEANLSAATLVGATQDALVSRPFARFILREDQDIHFRHLNHLFETGKPQKYELLMVRKDGTAFWACLEATAAKDAEGAPLCRVVLSDITERKEAEQVRQKLGRRYKLDELYRSILHASPDNITITDLEGRILMVSPKALTMFSCEKEEELQGRFFTDFIVPEDRVRASPNVTLMFQGVMSGLGEYRGLRLNGSSFDMEVNGEFIRDAEGQPTQTVFIIRDITARKQVEAYRDMGREILQLLNEPGDLQESIQRIISTLKARTGFDAVGIRLQEGEDYPYFAQNGFSQNFLATENSLVERADGGGLCRGKDGKVCLECTCGLVISGRTDQASALFTPGGSIWISDTFPLLELPAEADPRHHPRNLCIHQGYASVALVPIRNQERIVGLIQFNDRRKGCFTLESVEVLEGIAAHLGGALLRKQAEEALVQSERRHRAILQTALDGFWLVDEEGHLLEVNEAYCRMSGYSGEELLGKRISDLEAAESTQETRLHIQKILALGKDRFETKHRHKDGHLFDVEVSVQFPPSSGGKMVAFLRDLTERKSAEAWAPNPRNSTKMDAD